MIESSTITRSGQITSVKTTVGGVPIRIEAVDLGGEQKVAGGIPSFDGVSAALEQIATAVVTAMEQAKPRRASAEFSLSVAVEAGQLIALWVKGSGSANLKVTLEWGEEQ